MEPILMPNLSIKNVPDSLLEKLRERAARHHRSIQGELMALLSAAVELPVAAEPSAAAEPPKMRRSGTRRIDAIAAEHRSRWKKPFSRGPRAVDLIRSERDAR
jgi:plasmid stability protein